MAGTIKRPATADTAKKGKARKAQTPAWPPDKKRLAAVLRVLDTVYGNATCELGHESPFQLLCATILSAQCTDERVNLVTPALFARFPTPAAMANAGQEEMETIIRSTGFFRNKAKNLIATARLLRDEFAGEVPRTMDELLRLPGVARKTANVVLGTCFGIPSGVVVDTHVARLSQRLALTRHADPKRIEADLMAILPRDRWIGFSHQLIWHGRRQCHARSPKCDTCPMVPHCPAAEISDGGRG